MRLPSESFHSAGALDPKVKLSRKGVGAEGNKQRNEVEPESSEDQIVRPTSAVFAALGWTASVCLSVGGQRHPAAEWNSWKHQTKPY